MPVLSGRSANALVPLNLKKVQGVCGSISASGPSPLSKLHWIKILKVPYITHGSKHGKFEFTSIKKTSLTVANLVNLHPKIKLH